MMKIALGLDSAKSAQMRASRSVIVNSDEAAPVTPPVPVIIWFTSHIREQDADVRAMQ
jgi:hypothetical protein